MQPSLFPTPRLRTLKIRGFRAIDDLTLTFARGIDDAGALVVAGENGCGKTSALEALLVLFGRLDLLPGDAAPDVEQVRLGSRDFHLEAHLDPPTDGGWWVDREQLATLRALRESSPRGDLTEQLRSVRWGGPSPAEFPIEYFSARREPENLGAALTDLSGPRSTREKRRLAELKRRLFNVWSRARRNHTFTRLERFLQRFVGAAWELDVAWLDAHEGGDATVVLRNGPMPLDGNGEPRTLAAIRARAADGVAMPTVLPIDRLSSGQMALLALAYPFVFSDPPIALALLDEPEQHLHPTWQRALLPALRELSPETLFVVATHSPQVLDSVGRHERVQLTRLDPSPVEEAR